MLCYFLLISLGSLSFSEGKKRKSGSGGEGRRREGETRRTGARGKCSRDLIYEKLKEDKNFTLVFPKRKSRQEHMLGMF